MEKYVTKEKFEELVDKHNELCVLLQSMELNKLADFTSLTMDVEDDEEEAADGEEETTDEESADSEEEAIDEF